MKPSQATLDAIAKAFADPAFRVDLEAYARGRARILSRLEGFASDHAKDLVQAAMVDTLEGRRTWDEASGIPLCRHLQGVIWSRASHEYERARHLPRSPIDPDNPPDLEAPNEDHEADHQHVLERIAEVRERAADDPQVLRLLDAYEQGVERRGAVLALTGLTHHEYEAARDRLLRLRPHLARDHDEDVESQTSPSKFLSQKKRCSRSPKHARRRSRGS